MFGLQATHRCFYQTHWTIVKLNFKCFKLLNINSNCRILKLRIVTSKNKLDVVSDSIVLLNSIHDTLWGISKIRTKNNLYKEMRHQNYTFAKVKAQ